MRLDPSRNFIREVKGLTKRYWSIEDDLEDLKKEILANPRMGTPIGKSCYKIRMAIASKGKGKSGGARVITCVKVLADRVILLSIYDKSEKEDLEPGRLAELLAEEGLE